MQHFYEKIILSFLAMLGINVVGQAQTKTENYILTKELLEATTDTTKANTSAKQYINKITYFDGLGREKLSIVSPKAGLSMAGFSNVGMEFINPSLATKVTYDGFGRVDREYLPGVVGDLSYTEAVTYTDYPEAQVYSQKKYENSPLNRVLKQGAPGATWDVNTNRAISFDYQTNSGDNVLMFGINQALTNSGNNISLTITGAYQNGMLYKTTTTDENGQPIIEFKDKEGRVILKRIQTGGKEFNTYYVYDIYGNLACVLPPKLMELVNNGTNVLNYISLLKELAYQYRYDDKNRLVEKKLPGKGWEYMLYDKQDRLVGVQDENMRNENYWVFTKYDRFGRVAITGKTWEAEGRTRDQIQAGINDHLGNNNVSRDATGYKQDNIIIYYNEAGFGYNNHVLTVNYYDDYPMTQEGVSLAGNALGQSIVTGGKLKGLPTLTVMRSLGTWENNGWNFEYNYTFYDNKYLRPIKTYKINYLGGSTIVESELDFRGKAKQVVTTHKRLKTDAPLKVTEVFSYDKFERLTKHTHQINSGKVEVLTQNNYNNIGQLTSKKVGNTMTSPYQTVDYNYNIRGWLTQINDITNLGTDLFAYKINYNTKDQTKASHNTQELFNGNISQTFWLTQENSFLRSYDYKYDGLNRLTNANYSNLAKDFAGTYDEQLSYDYNGNIKTLKRYGQTEQATPRLIDDLVYDYENTDKSNKLQKVTDSSTTLGFNDGNKTGNDYAYDVNGNLTKDLNKGITGITYNFLNLPTEVLWNGSKKINYAYNAAGVKLNKVVTDGTKVNKTEYLDGFQYKDGVLQFFPTTEGYVNAITAGTLAYNYVYNLTDHLGNVRVSYAWDDVNNKLKTVNEDHYYPFGLQHKGYDKPPKDITGGIGSVEIGIGLGTSSGSANYKYKYNGQELQDELGLNWYNYRYRNYDPAIGRFFGVDPISEDYYNISTYQFAHNNPVWKIEIEGLEGAPTTNKDIQSEAGNNKAYNEWKQHNTSKYSLSEAFGAGSPWKWSNSARVVANNFATRGASKDAKDAVLKRNGPIAEDSDRGSDRGAYRHALWSAIMTKEYGAETAKSVADSHEGTTIDISNKNNINNIVQADGIADELNNQIGRKYGEERSFATKKGLALTILDIFKTEGLYTIKQNKDGTFNVTKTNLSEKDWKDLRNRITELNDNGKDK
ncbi:DUF6443 domain-containing protein [Empedobacter tilapiae]|uniref:RHS repeat-associated core domain-containing protein n=1 Tax=Empedobacter tilapiae TaxID=2491114 RepID=A0A4Z1ASZ9_9FLAO|nr:DUF6443 domain-containing protein [Empedobacter tilapiae]TGN21923.1 RHS repeat-associated core domain-containing protein [Empedobacter tilapiae]